MHFSLIISEVRRAGRAARRSSAGWSWHHAP